MAFKKSGEPCILIREEANPDDFPGMVAAEGILTIKGGSTSHAAVVARGMGKPCVSGASHLIIDSNKKELRVKNHIFKEFDTLTIDGSNGEVIYGEVPTLEPKLFEEFSTLMKWANEIKKLIVRANAETVLDTQAAIKFTG